MENIEQVFENLQLSEETVAQIKTIFEAAVAEKVKVEVKTIKEGLDTENAAVISEATELAEANAKRYGEYLHEQYEAKGKELVESFNQKVNEMEASNETALSEAVSEWVAANKVAVNESIKVQRLTAFADGLRGLFLEHGVEIPEAEFSLAEETNKKLSEQVSAIQLENESLKTALNTLNEEIEAGKRTAIFSQVTDGLSEMQIEKLKSLSESLKAETTEDYKNGLNTLKEAFLKPAINTPISEGEKKVTEKQKNPLNEAVRQALRGQF